MPEFRSHVEREVAFGFSGMSAWDFAAEEEGERRLILGLKGGEAFGLGDLAGFHQALIGRPCTRASSCKMREGSNDPLKTSPNSGFCSKLMM